MSIVPTVRGALFVCPPSMPSTVGSGPLMSVDCRTTSRCDGVVMLSKSGVNIGGSAMVMVPVKPVKIMMSRPLAM